ncbi:hypothetical protein C2845_PMPSC006806 [Panicum miliaceum]|uniref:Uncharacterized protein n=1 Tax=Panicum miliaceum TaxID=4540 RepID=A0A3L6PD07_PANMI|nr:hypothetical protein C2845_PMPSC006806 [Panicum miliaceum]
MQVQNGRASSLQLPYAPQRAYTSHCDSGWAQNIVHDCVAPTHVSCLICPFTSMMNLEMILLSFIE